MKLVVLIAALALAVPAFAQNKPDAPKPAAQDAKPMQQASAKPRKPNPKRFEDARHCLQLPTSTEIIKCSEEYL